MPYLFWMVLPFAMWDALAFAPVPQDKTES